MNIRLEIHDGGRAVDAAVAQMVICDMRRYRVTAESGLFKNGKSYHKGDEIELERASALNFVAINEVEEI